MTSLRLPRPVYLHLAKDGSLSAWVPASGTFEALSPEEVAVLARFGTPCTAADALDAAGFVADPASLARVEGLRAGGLLQAEEEPSSPELPEVEDGEWFARHAATWMAEAHAPGGWARRRSEVVRRLLAGRPPGAVLDIGCGGGAVALALAADGHDVTGIDAAPAMIALAEEARGTAAPEVAARLRFAVGNAHGPFPDRGGEGAFDTVIALGVLDYLEDVSAFFRAAAEVLAVGGRLVVTTGNRLSHLWQPGPRMEAAVARGEAPALIEELAGLARSGTAAAPGLVRRLRAVVAALEARTDLDVACPAPPAWGPLSAAERAAEEAVDARGFTPRELAAHASAVGLVPEGFRGLYGASFPALDGVVHPAIAAALGAAFEDIDGPASLVWSREMLAVFTARGRL